MTAAAMELTIEPAGEAEAPAALALLPAARGIKSELLIARRGATLIGAAAIGWRPGGKPEGLPVDIEVLPGHRRQGVGRALAARAAALAAEEADGLWSLRLVAPESDAARFLERCGFAPRRRELHFQAAVGKLLEHLTPLADALRARGRIPQEARVVDLTEAPLEEIAWMVSADLGGGPFEAAERLRRRFGGEAESEDRSLVALCGERVAGVVLWRAKDGQALVDGRVVSRADRNGWANLILLEAGLRRCEADGLSELRFHCEDTVSDTLRLAQRCDAELVETRLGYRLELTA
jgi:GNAT superfamily N-acetyltransferase